MDKCETFLFKHNHLFNSIDNDILLEILSAIHGQRKAVVSTKSIDIVMEIEIIPVKVMHDSIYGRQYLVAYNEQNQGVSVFRIDRIEGIAIGEVAGAENYSKAIQECGKDRECWSISGVENEPTEVKVEFIFDEEKERFILQRIMREGHGGKVEKLADGRYLYCISVRDPKEMIPWIRSFGERAKVLSSGAFEIEKNIAEDWKKAVEKYEALS